MRIVAKVPYSDHYLLGCRISDVTGTFDKVLETEKFKPNEIYEAITSCRL